MSENLPPELASLPPPQVINEIDFEARLVDFKAILQTAFDDAGIAYNVSALETDPAIILVEVAAYQDILIRQRVNEAIRANLLPFAKGADLDILSQFYDVTRLFQESDALLRKRVVLAIQGRSTGGTVERYKSIALAADARVADVAVYTIDKNPTVHVAIFASDNNGIADAPLLAAVDGSIQAPDKRMVNDIIVVASAAQFSIDVSANITLLPQADALLIADLQSNLQNAWANELGLGRDVTRSWLIAQLQCVGVQKVELSAPLSDVEIPFNQAATLGSVVLEIAGRAY